MIPDDCYSSGGEDLRNPWHLLLVSPSSRLVREAVGAGFSVWTVNDVKAPRDAHEVAVAAGTAGRSLQADFADPSALRDLLVGTVREHRIGRLLAFGAASTLPAVLDTAERLGLSPNPAESVRLLSDPSAMRSMLNLSGDFYLASACAGSADEPPIAVETPVHGSADAGDPAGRERHPDGYLVEALLHCQEFGVETLTRDGMHRVVGIAALNRVGPAGCDSVFPAPLAARNEAGIRAAATRLLDLVGYEFGFAWIVVVLTGDGPRVVSCRPQQADEPIGRLIELADGFNPETELVRALSGERPHSPITHRHAAATAFRLPAGRLVSVSGLDEIAELPGVHDVHFPYGPGDTLPGPGEDSRALVVLSAGSAAELADGIAEAQRLLRTEVSRRGSDSAPDLR